MRQKDIFLEPEGHAWYRGNEAAVMRFADAAPMRILETGGAKAQRVWADVLPHEEDGRFDVLVCGACLYQSDRLGLLGIAQN